MELVRIQNKMKLLFSKVLEPGYVLNSYYADSLINKLSSNGDKETCELSNMPFMSDFIVDSLDIFDKLDNSVQVFVIRIVAIVSKGELQFTKIICKQSVNFTNHLMEITKPTTNASLKVAYLEVVLQIVQHGSGRNWLLETGAWKEILSLCNTKQTVFVIRQTYKFAAELLWQLNDVGDLTNIKTVLSYILKPLDQDFIMKESLSSEQEEELAKTIDPMLHILSAIVNSENRVGQYSILLDTFEKEYQVLSHLYVIFDRLHREETVASLAKLMFWFNLAKSFLVKPVGKGVKYTMEDFLEVSVIFLNTMHHFAQRRYASIAIDYCTSCNLICRTVFQRQKDEDSTEQNTIELVNQMLFMCLVPLIMFVKHGKPNSNQTDDRLDEFISKILNSTCELTAKAVFSLRSLLEQSDTMQLIVQSVKKLSNLKNQLSNEQANLVFQTLFYVLRDFDPIDDYGVAKHDKQFQNYENDHDKVLVMTYVMDTVLCLLKNNNISWCESLEVICLYNVVYSILQRPNLTIKFVVAALNVIAMAVKLFLPPNLSLLLDSKPGSSMDLLGKLIYDKMHDLAWEVRDSALELLYVVIDISFVKFPPFQKQILDNKLISVAAALAFNDFESYVQVSALKCLAAATKINSVWDQLRTEYPNIQNKLIFLLRNNQEGMVRKEACYVLTEIYLNLKPSPSFKENLYEHMTSSALSDFHWEVQQAALKFWKFVFHSMLTDQGMLDGTFPPVTFSKEKRKIVTLNEAQIQKILIKILDELAGFGILTVLIKLLDDDTEVDVLDCALHLSNEILDVLNKYKVCECLKSKPDDVLSVDELMCQIKEDTEESKMTEESTDMPAPDVVIESILNANDINLLANIYEKRMTLNQEDEELCKPKVKLLKLASPYLFVQYLGSKDFKSVLSEKRKWNDGIRSFSSLLDDVLGIYEVNKEINSLDCY